MRTSFIYMVIIGFFAFVACEKSNDDDNNEYKPIELDIKSASLVESSNVFGTEIFRQILDGESYTSNVMISPLSIFQALSMTRNGAQGETLDEMNQVLVFDESVGDDINEYQKKLIDALMQADKEVTLDVANSIWYREGFSVLQDFIKTNQDYYNAEVSALDFSDAEGAKKTINNWVDKQTNGKISEIVDEVTAEHVMFLINAIYFYGEWQNEFSAKDTEEELFYPETSASYEVKMMHQENEFEYVQNETFSMVMLPYGNGHFNMVVLLPNTDKKVSDVMIELTDENWNLWMNSMYQQDIILSLPKFKYECEYELKDPLVEMGMPTAFSGAADFTGINSDGGIRISKVKHKTFIEVDEKGTEAAAVTSVEMELTSMPSEPVYFTANKPFVFAITEKDTNTILFMGKLMQPEQ